MVERVRTSGERGTGGRIRLKADGSICGLDTVGCVEVQW